MILSLKETPPTPMSTRVESSAFCPAPLGSHSRRRGQPASAGPLLAAPPVFYFPELQEEPAHKRELNSRQERVSMESTSDVGPHVPPYFAEC